MVRRHRSRRRCVPIDVFAAAVVQPSASAKARVMRENLPTTLTGRRAIGPDKS